MAFRKPKSFFNTTIQKYNIYAIIILEVPDSMVAAPELNQFMLEFDLGRLAYDL